MPETDPLAHTIELLQDGERWDAALRNLTMQLTGEVTLDARAEITEEWLRRRELIQEDGEADIWVAGAKAFLDLVPG